MDEGEKRFGIFCIGFFLCVLIIIAVCVTAHHTTIRTYIKNGYTQKTLPTTTYPKWVKE